MISEAAIEEWRQYCPWYEQKQVEQDLLLHAMIQLIYSDPYLSEKLAFRGGTCLNKLYFRYPYRYSEDLDFVQIKAEKIGPVIDRLKMVLSDIFLEKPLWEAKKGSFRLHYTFMPEDSGYRQKIKIEINTREHFAVKGYVKKRFKLNSLWRSGESHVVTFQFEELMATKLRALYQRRKGRDLFDLWVSRELNPDFKSIVEIFSEYMRRENNPVTQKQFITNLQDKMKIPVFLNDIKPLIRRKVDYNPVQAQIFVNETLLFLLPE